MVDVFVGPERKAFHLHRDLLCDRSAYFKAAFMGNFAEASSKEIQLPEDDDTAFELLVKWLYGGTLQQPKTDEELSAYFALLALSEKFTLEHLQNLCIDLVRGYCRDSRATVRAQDISFLYENTEGGFKRIFIAKLAALQTAQLKTYAFLPGFRDLLGDGGQFAADFSWYLMRNESTKDKTAMVDEGSGRHVSCWFHTHDSTPRCEVTTKSPETVEQLEAMPREL